MNVEIREGETSTPAAALSIAVVDDHLAFADTLATLVRLAGYGATVVDPRGATETAERIARLSPTIAFVDVSLAHFDGCDVVVALRQRGSRARVIAITGDWRVETARRCIDCGFDEVWHKPIDPARLEAFLDNLADRGDSNPTFVPTQTP
jgi:two-component system response regulator DegU